MSDITVIKRSLTDRAQAVAEYLLPAGVRDGREWAVGSVAGEAGRSLKVCLAGSKVGTWADFASGESGDLIDLWRAVRRQTLTEALDDIRGWLGIEAPKFEKPVKTWHRPKSPKCEFPHSAVLDYLLDQRKLSAEALSLYGVGETGRMIVFPSRLPSGELAFVKYLGIDRDAKGKKITRVEAGCEPVLFGWQAIAEDAREIAITEGEIDAVTLWDYGFPALSVPFGGGGGLKQQWIASEFDRMLRFETIYLALDNDKEGDAGAEEIANRLGRHRCRRVRLPQKDANECRTAGLSYDEIARCFKESESLDPPELRRAGEFSDQVLALFHPPAEAAAEPPGYCLPFAKLGDDLRLRPGELSIWTGPTGAGKSQLLSHVCVDIGRQGGRVCVASLEMAPRETLKRMVRQAGNTDRPTGPFARACMAWLDNWLWIVTIVGKSPVKRLLDVFEYARARYGCDTFVVDSLMRLGIGPDDYEGQERAVFELVNWTVGNAVHLHLVAHARKMDRASSGVPELDDVKGTSEISSNAFNVFAVWRNRKLEDELRQAEESAKFDAKVEAKLLDLRGRPPVVLNVAKQRNGDWEGKLGLWFNQASYQYRSAADDRHGRRYIEWAAKDEDAA